MEHEIRCGSAIKKAGLAAYRLLHRTSGGRIYTCIQFPALQTQQQSDTMISLFCWVYGDPHSFPVLINLEDTSSSRQAQPSPGNRCRSPQPLEENHPDQRQKEEDELDETWRIGKYFEEAPQEERIHIIIKLPEPIGVEAKRQKRTRSPSLSEGQASAKRRKSSEPPRVPPKIPPRITVSGPLWPGDNDLTYPLRERQVVKEIFNDVCRRSCIVYGPFHAAKTSMLYQLIANGRAAKFSP
ncbi:hypothetical protein V8E54_013183 [Elaphomyces granulatus]